MTTPQIKHLIQSANREYANSAQYIDGNGNQSLSTAYEAAMRKLIRLSPDDIRSATGREPYEALCDGVYDAWTATVVSR